MSRLGSLSAAALQALFAQESNDTLVILLTLTGGGLASPIRVADNYDQRLSETSDEVVYGITSNAVDYTYIPFNLTLPTEESEAAPRCSLAIQDVTRIIMPQLRQLTEAPSVQIDLVLKSNPNTVEATFGNFLLSNISYNANTVTGEPVVESLSVEPFPAHSFTPSYFPGLF